jgi:hypothetical protein
MTTKQKRTEKQTRWAIWHPDFGLYFDTHHTRRSAIAYHVWNMGCLDCPQYTWGKLDRAQKAAWKARRQKDGERAVKVEITLEFEV